MIGSTPLCGLGGCEPRSARTQGAFIPGRMGATEDAAMRRFAAAAPPTTHTPTNSLTSRRAGAWNRSSRLPGMSASTAERRARFRELHAQDGIFVMPNPWDAGSARLLAWSGFEALATTSAGFAWTLGKDDQSVTRDELLDHV